MPVLSPPPSWRSRACPPIAATVVLLALWTSSSHALTVADLDTDSDGLADTWEIKHFGGLQHANGDPTDDPDGDGRDNLEECAANTNPNDASQFFEFVTVQLDPSCACVTWCTVFAKKYQIELTSDLNAWSVLESTPGNSLYFRGTGGDLTADYSDTTAPLITGAATRHLWYGLGSIPADLDAHFAALVAGDADGEGTEWHGSLETPTDDGEAYSSKVSGYIVPKAGAGGNYNFYVASRGPSKVTIYTDDTPTSVLATCRVDDANLNTEKDWLADPVQKSAQVTLVEGTRYYFEALHVHDSGLDHFAVGWEESGNPGVIEVIPGDCLSPAEDFSSHNASDFFDGGNLEAVRVGVFGSLSFNDFDIDGDGIDDSTEGELSDFGFNPHKANGTNNGAGNDGDTLAELLNFNPATDKEEVAAVAIDNEAIENLTPPLLAGDVVDLGNLGPGDTSGTSTDTITIRLSRNKGLHPLTVNYTIDTAGSGTEPAPTPGVDYNATEGIGGPVADGTVTLPAFVSAIDIHVTVEKDAVHEYPETINCSIDATVDHDPAPGAGVAKAEIIDMPSNVNILFVGAYEKDFNAASSVANGAVSGYLKGDKRKFIMRNDSFGNLSSPQIDTHFHKVLLSGSTETGGPPIHDILNALGTDALLGYYLTYDWDLTEQNPVTPTPGPGNPSRQVVIDSLFNQNGQTQIYVNLHTDDNAGGETMARLSPATGSVSPPDTSGYTAAAPGSAEFPQLSGAELERDIIRFLNQATFGAAWEDVQAIRTAIETKRGPDPGYHRVEEFELWIEEQCKMEQTYILDYTLALDALSYNLRGLWDPNEWNDWSTAANNPNTSGDPDVEPVPLQAGSHVGMWTYIDRSLTDGPAPGMPNTHPHFWGNQWYPVGRYFTDSDWRSWMDDEAGNEGLKVVRNLGQNGPQYFNRRRAHWMMMVNANDQLRHKWGYAIQQILVVAETLQLIRDRPYPSANYQDMLNLYGLPSDRDLNGTLDADEQTYFRDLIGFINWNPVMGYWLSSLRNRAAYDSNADGIVDVFPDENLAREDMQLFTIGLFNLWLDGSLQLQAGGSDPNTPPGSSATYTNDDIQEFARIITGLNHSRRTLNNRSPNLGTENNFVRHGWNGAGFREGPYGWGIETTGDFADKGNVFDTDNTNDTNVAPDTNDAADGDDGIYYNTSFTNTSSGDRSYGHEWNYPMRMFGKSGTDVYHDLGVKTIAGGRVINNTGLLDNQATPENSSDASIIAMGVQDYEDALDWFAGKLDGNASADFTGDAGDPLSSHASTPPFISRRLIQRMVTSNPSSGYLYRVATAFKDSEGCMIDVCKAVLLDQEARTFGAIDDSFGMKKSPLEAYIQVLRTFEGHSLLPLTDDPSLPPFSLPPYNGSWPTVDGTWNPGNYNNPAPTEDIYATNYGYPASQADNFRFNCLFQFGNTDGNLSISPFAQETVFNYYLPDYSSGLVQSAALVAPEMQLATETEVVRNHNYFWTLTWQWNTNRTTKADGQDVQELGGSNLTQREAFGVPTDSGSDVDHHDRVRIDFVRWGDLLYVDIGTGAANSLTEAEDLLDKIDQRLMGGALKEKYPFDESDDDSDILTDYTGNPREPTSGDGIIDNDLDARNPREWIIHTVATSHGDGNTEAERRDKFRLTLYLLSQTPEFLIKK